MPRRRADGFVMISIISERYNIHPQTLRLYEREGLIKPSRTSGNTRLYGEDEIRKLEMILTLTRDLLDRPDPGRAHASPHRHLRNRQNDRRICSFLHRREGGC